jgi:hypothetical protein
MDKHQLDLLQTKALALLSKREEAKALTVVHVATDLVPSTKARIFKFFAAEEGTPNDPRYEIVVDEKGELVDLASLRERENFEPFALRDFELDRRQLGELRAAESPITIHPTVNELVLNPEDSSTEVITVSIPRSTSTQKFDVYFLADATGSMTPVLAAIKMSANAILTDLSGRGLDIAFGVGNYTDFPNPSSPFVHQLSLRTNLADVAAAMASWVASGGGDIPEGQLFALDQIAEDRDGLIGWRLESKRFIVWFGDAPGHDAVCTAISGLTRNITVGSVIGKLVRQGITVVAISTTGPGLGPGLDADPKIGATDYVAACGPPGGNSGQATTLADATGGAFVTGIMPPDVPAAVVGVIVPTLTAAATRVNDVHLDATDAAADFVTAVFPNRVGPISTTDDQEIRFEVQFTGVKPCADQPQVFEGTIAAVVDRDVKATKRLRVTVPPCPPIKHYVEIQDSPSAAVRFGNRGQISLISVFARGPAGQLLRCFDNGNPENVGDWSWEDRGQPVGTRVSYAPFAVASFQNQGEGFIHAFVRGDDGHLYEVFWNGLHWSNWIDHDEPWWNASVAFSPTVVTYQGTYPVIETNIFGQDETHIYSDTTDRLFAFVMGDDGKLYHHQQVWHEHGRCPNRTNVVSVPGFAKQHFVNRSVLYAFVVGNDDRLYASMQADPHATRWIWFDLGRPTPNTGVTWLFRPGTVWFFFDGDYRFYTFVSGHDGHLWHNVWRGTGLGTWGDRGSPSPGVSVVSAASVVTYPGTKYPPSANPSNNQIYAFVRGSDNHLHVHFWDAGNGTWVWRDLGQPAANATVRSDPSAVISKHPNRDPIYVFVRGNNDHLYMCHMDSGVTNPQWLDLS